LRELIVTLADVAYEVPRNAGDAEKLTAAVAPANLRLSRKSVVQNSSRGQLPAGVQPDSPRRGQAKTIAKHRIDLFASRCRRSRATARSSSSDRTRPLDLLLTCALTGSARAARRRAGTREDLMVKALAAAFRWKFARVQFTPDLMPSDITATNCSAAMTDRRAGG